MESLRREVSIWFQLVLLITIWFLVLIASGAKLEFGWAAVAKLPDVVTIYLILLLIFSKWAWRWRLFRNWFVRIPDLQGTWRGILKSTWVDPATGRAIPEKPVILVIRQTLSSISCVMFTNESDCFSTAAQINEDDESGVFRLSYNYVNRPLASVRSRSEIHDGAAMLRIVSKPSMELKGEYFTSRRTTGELTVVFESKDLAEKFD
jgi:hypothetical protein